MEIGVESKTVRFSVVKVHFVPIVTQWDKYSAALCRVCISFL